MLLGCVVSCRRSIHPRPQALFFLSFLLFVNSRTRSLARSVYPNSLDRFRQTDIRCPPPLIPLRSGLNWYTGFLALVHIFMKGVDLIHTFARRLGVHGRYSRYLMYIGL
ncbi:uncharacterized protein GGS22DRAFT_97722 [Annulohypoxylon maeteangense]|uniref:uncharacterized protein n=1 Tax=Annulohypoxylon maeteangense TaxID=1927788 RepID=UPI0020079D47|nr:uncharacterized protein GGS22DRAFT_97722 [Annulohypoxylon maeteangense]KAI0888468.1 hypothetical protein GGS22DRAFT_97722 [Annulohypoxylon maeteangense]